MKKLKQIILFLFIFLPLVLFASDELIRIGGLDIPVTNYGSIRIGPHKN